MSKQVYLVIGARGTGKSTLLEGRVKSLNYPIEDTYIYDIERRYFPNREGPLPDIKTFKNTVANVKNSLVVYEEGTIFFPNRGHDEKLKMLLVQSRYNGNIVFIVFHSINSIPFYVYELTDTIILFRTQDEAQKVEKKLSKLYKPFLYLQKFPEKCQQFKLLNGKLSPYLIIDL
jgi:predicted ATPase